MKTFFAALVACTLIANGAFAASSFFFPLTPELAGTDTNDFGVCRVTIYPTATSTRVEWIARVKLTSPYAAAHFHGPTSMAGVDGPVMADLSSDFTDLGNGVFGGEGVFETTSLDMNTTVTELYRKAFAGKQFYLNIHTEANPNGHIRGHPLVIPEGTVLAGGAIIKSEYQLNPVDGLNADGMAVYTVRQTTEGGVFKNVFDSIVVSNDMGSTEGDLTRGWATLENRPLIDLNIANGCGRARDVDMSELAETQLTLYELTWDHCYINLRGGDESQGAGRVRGQIITNGGMLPANNKMSRQFFPLTEANAAAPNNDGSMGAAMMQFFRTSAITGTVYYEMAFTLKSNATNVRAQIRGPITSATATSSTVLRTDEATPGLFDGQYTVSGTITVTNSAADTMENLQYYVQIVSDEGNGLIRGQPFLDTSSLQFAGGYIANLPQQVVDTVNATGGKAIISVTVDMNGMVRAQGAIATQNEIDTETAALAGGVHIHGPAHANQNAGLMAILAPQSSETGIVDVTVEFLESTGLDLGQELAALAKSMSYVNVHTFVNGNGEIRGTTSVSTGYGLLAFETQEPLSPFPEPMEEEEEEEEGSAASLSASILVALLALVAAVFHF